MSLVVPFGRQNGLSVGLDSRGTMTEETYDAAGVLLARETPFAKMFVIRRATGGRWLNVAVLPPSRTVSIVRVGQRSATEGGPQLSGTITMYLPYQSRSNSRRSVELEVRVER